MTSVDKQGGNKYWQRLNYVDHISKTAIIGTGDVGPSAWDHLAVITAVPDIKQVMLTPPLKEGYELWSEIQHHQ